MATSMPANAIEPAVAMTSRDMTPPGVKVPGADAPVPVIESDKLKTLGQNLLNMFEQYKQDRRLQELRWLRNLRQYLGYYDPEVEKMMAPNRSKAYPKVTRVKCISVLARIMDLMFPSDDRNWTLEARPSADMDIKDVMSAVQKQQQDDAAQNNGTPPPLTKEYVTNAVMKLAAQRANVLSKEIDDQLEELGGDQTYDYVQLNGEVVASGILYGLGMLRGPFVREVNWATWGWDETKKQPISKRMTKYMPQFEFLNCWDFYPDLSAKRLEKQDGYFTRLVMGKKELRELAKRSDFFEDVIKDYLKQNTTGNYKAQPFETELREMGIKVNVNDNKFDGKKYEIYIWHGPIDADMLTAAGVVVPEEKMSDLIDAEVWIVDGWVIKAIMNPYVELGTEIRTLHHFLFDKDDTAPIGFGLPNIMRDTQMSISAATRMMLDNASVVCGPILEMNTNLLRADQDLNAISAYKTFYRNDDGPTAQYPAVREIKVESHINDLQSIIKLSMQFADMETFVGPATGGDMEKMPSEPMRNAAGASMLLGNAALPFKQIIRNFDKFTKGVIQSLVLFNRQFNDEVAQEADYDVIARGATSLIAKELRGIQVDALAASLKPEEAIHVDMRKLVEARFRVRDLENMLVSEQEAAQRQSVQDQAAQLDKQLQQAGIEANTRNLLSQAFKNIAQGQKNQAAASADAINAALAILEKGEGSVLNGKTIQQGGTQNPGGASDQIPPPIPTGAAGGGGAGVDPQLGGAGAVLPGGMPAGGLPSGAGTS